MPANLVMAHVSQEVDATDQPVIELVLDGDPELHAIEQQIADATTHDDSARLGTARALKCRSDLLLLDEPTNHLDLEMRQALSVALQEVSGAVVLVSHDQHLLNTVADELIVVHDGHAVRPFHL